MTTARTIDELQEVRLKLSDVRAAAVGIENRLFDERDERLLGIIEQVVNAIEHAGKSATIAVKVASEYRAQELREGAAS